MSTPKKQTDFSFSEAKEFASFYCSRVASFAENWNSTIPNSMPLQWAIELRVLESKIKNSTGKCLSNDEIQLLWNFAHYLIDFKPEIQPQLLSFWNLYHDVFKKLANNKSHPGYSVRNFIIEVFPRINRADRLAEKITVETNENRSSMLVPVSLLLIHVIRTETIEHAFLKQINDAIRTFNLSKKYDAEAMCSIAEKIKQRGNWRTDIRAIRNAIAHGCFSINFTNDKWELDISNEETGSTFNKRFTSKEFKEFFNLATLLFKIQWHLLIILTLLTILATHFSLEIEK